MSTKPPSSQLLTSKHGSKFSTKSSLQLSTKPTTASSISSTGSGLTGLSSLSKTGSLSSTAATKKQPASLLGAKTSSSVTAKKPASLSSKTATAGTSGSKTASSGATKLLPTPSPPLVKKSLSQSDSPLLATPTPLISTPSVEESLPGASTATALPKKIVTAAAETKKPSSSAFSSSASAKLTGSHLQSSSLFSSSSSSGLSTSRDLLSGTTRPLSTATGGHAPSQAGGSLLAGKTSLGPTSSLLSSASSRGLLTSRPGPQSTGLRKDFQDGRVGMGAPVVKATVSPLSAGSTADVATHVEKQLMVQSEIAKEAEKSLPQYALLTTEDSDNAAKLFVPPDLDLRLKASADAAFDITALKRNFVHAISASLLSSPNFRDRKNATFRVLADKGAEVARYDAEFPLKVAAYTRRYLNIRTTANFLLALSANLHACRGHLRKYFSASIRLPSDWIEVAEIYQAFHDKSLNFGSLPTALRKSMCEKFPEFDAYQLAKYNKDKSASKKKKQKRDAKSSEKGETKGSEKGETKSSEKGAAKGKPPAVVAAKKGQVQESSSDSDSDDDSVVGDDESESEEELERLTFTLKQLIRKLHIVRPVDHVMSILGKKYPEDPELFRRSGMPGMWDQDQAGKRMKLATPETWETQVSLRGNKAEVWEDLLNHRKLPFMAMLRNLRNLLLSQMSQKHHRMVINKLTDERAVVNSKQFPFRFFSAYDVLSDLEKIGEGEMEPPVKKPFQAGKKGGKDQKKFKKKKKVEVPLKDRIDVSLVKKYKSALDAALKISTCYNVKPIPGSTLILCNVGSNMDRPCTSARGLGRPRTVQEVGVLLSLMCKFSCEHCALWVYGPTRHVAVELLEGTILDNMAGVMATVHSHDLHQQPGRLPTSVLEEALATHLRFDNLLLLSDDSVGRETDEGRFVADFLKKYRRVVNPDLLFVSVNLSGRSAGFDSSVQPDHPNDIFLAGYSDQILRFIAERGDDGQLIFVQNIDKALQLKAVKRSGLRATADEVVPSLVREKVFLGTGQAARTWRTVRVFISSTFKDMHAERDLLTRYVFPELRARAHSRQVQLYELDLRWGVTEEDAKSERAVEICLGEVSRCQYFLGMLGDRYGWCMERYPAPDTPEYDWVREYPPGRSITELEIYHAALAQPEEAQKKAFFFFRDPSFLQDVPEEHRPSFVRESHEAHSKLENLKSKIRTSGLEVHDNYSARWLGVAEGKPMAGGLEDFGRRVLNVMWNRIQKDFPEVDPDSDPLVRAHTAHTSFAQSEAEKFVGRAKLLGKAEDVVAHGQGQLVVGAGKPGSGKSAFMAAFLHRYTTRQGQGVDWTGLADVSCSRVVYHFIGAAPESGNLDNILFRICHKLKEKFSLALSVPEDISELLQCWPEFLKEASEAVEGKGGVVMLLIDALDLLEDAHGARALEWIPALLPPNVTLFVSCRDGQSAYSNLMHRRPAPTVLTIGALDVFDKSEMVRRRLGKHNKQLEESAFNNQMKLLLTKKEAVNPLYLHLACEELRVFGIFEQVSAKIRQMSSTVAGLLQEILLRLEEDHGRELVGTALSLLVVAQNGLQENELSALLAVYGTVGVVQEGGVQRLPPITVARLFRSLLGYLQPTSQESNDLLAFSHQDIEKAVRQRYMKAAGNADFERKLHTVASLYFKSQADPRGDGSFAGRDPRAFSELPYHLTMAGMWRDLEAILTSLDFISAKASFGLANRLLEDYAPSTLSLSPAMVRDLNKTLLGGKVEAFHSFVSRNLHVISSSPALVVQQAVNEPSASTVAQCAHRALQSASAHHPPVVEWVNKQQSEQPCQLTITGGLQRVLCVAVSADKTFAACGLSSGIAKVYEVATGREAATFTGHAGPVTGATFVGSDRVCTSSRDATLSLWDLKGGGFRIEVLRGHTHPVQAVVANAAGRVIVSASYDGTARVWGGLDGKEAGTLRMQNTSNRPINCVCFEPAGQLVAVGEWSTHVKIWDSFALKRLKVLRGHRTSVQCCAFSPSGQHVVSAALDGEIRIWSVRSAATLGTIAGHCQPVTSVAFSCDGKQLVTASRDRTVKVWSGTLGTAVLTVKREGSSVAASSIAVCQSDRGSTVLVGYHDGMVRQFDFTSGEILFEEAEMHEARVTAICKRDDFQGANNLALSTSLDKTAKIWDSVEPKRQIELTGHSESVLCAVWRDGVLATGSEDLTVIIWSEARLRELEDYILRKKGSGPPSIKPKVTLRGHKGPVTSLAYNKSSATLISGSQDKSVMFWDTINNELLRVLRNCHKDGVTAVALSNNHLVTGSNDVTLKLWDMDSDADAEKLVITGHSAAVSCADFSQGCIVSGDIEGRVKLWTRKGVEITTLFAHRMRVNACVLQVPGDGSFEGENVWADGEGEGEGVSAAKKRRQLQKIHLVTASEDGSVTVWKPFVSNELKTLVGHTDHVSGVAALGSSTVVSGSIDKTLKVWTLPGAREAEGEAHGGPVTAMDVNKDCSFAATASRDGTVILWHVRSCSSSSEEKEEKEEEGPAFELAHRWSPSKNEDAVVDVKFLGKQRLATCSCKSVVQVWRLARSGQPTWAASRTLANVTGLLTVGDDMMGTTSKGRLICTINSSTLAGSNTAQPHSEDWISAAVIMGTDAIVTVGLDKRIACTSRSRRGSVQGRLFDKPRNKTAKEDTWPLAVGHLYDNCVAVGDSDGFVSVFEADKGVLVMEKQLHSAAVNAVCALNDHTLVTGSDDSTVKIWDVQRVPGYKLKDPLSWKQVAQFHSTSQITSLLTLPNMAGMFLVGNKLGQVHILRFKL